MGAKVQGHPTRNQPHEGSGKIPNSRLHGCPSTTNRIPIHCRGAALPPSDKVQNAADRDVRRDKRPRRPPQYVQKSYGITWIFPVRCRAFAITLKGPTLAWFNRLPPSSVSSFTKLSIAFVPHFIGVRTYRKPSYHLLTIKQSSQESLRSYVQRFNRESLKVDILDKKFVVTAFIAGLGVQSKDLMFSISKNPQASMAEVLAKIEKYINGEEALISKQSSSSTQKEKGRGDKKRERSPKRKADRDRSPRRSRESRERSPIRRGNDRGRRGPPQPELQQRYSPQQYTPLTASISQVLSEVQHERFLRWPSQMKSDPVRRDDTKYCEFHKDHGHRTDDCIQLKKEIEYLIRRENLSR